MHPRIETYGVLLSLAEPDLRLVQVSANACGFFGQSAEALLGTPLDRLIGTEAVEELRNGVLCQDLEGRPAPLPPLRAAGCPHLLEGTVHRNKGQLILELELAGPLPDQSATHQLNAALIRAMHEMEGVSTVDELCRQTAIHTRHITGFDRVMIYKFLEEDGGAVVAESRREDLPPYLGVHYATPDLAQVRQLCLASKLRLKPDVQVPGVPLVPPIHPLTGNPPDLSYCSLREMASVHVDGLRAMNVAASMTISILNRGQLWGFIRCHHGAPRQVPRPVRTACEFLTRHFSSLIAAGEQAEARTYVQHLKQVQKSFGERIRRHGKLQTVLEQECALLARAVGADGFAFCLEDTLTVWGATPPEEDIRTLGAWLRTQWDGNIFCTDRLPSLYPPAQAFADLGSGLLAASTTPELNQYLLWFRGESIRTMKRGGSQQNGRGDAPRSYALWQETVRGRSREWADADCDFARSIRHLLSEALLNRLVEDVTRLNEELARSNAELDIFAYAASHDLQEPLRAVRAYGQLLERHAGNQLDEEGAGYLKVMQDASLRLSNLINSLLKYAKLGGASRSAQTTVDVEDVLRWTMLHLEDAIQQSHTEISYTELPRLRGDEEQLVQLFQNLVSNAIKYRRPEAAPRITITATRETHQWLFAVGDNGEGFPSEERERIFGVFARLHGYDVSGTGLGLSICRRIVERHGGRIWAESEPGKGSTFYFTLAAE